MFEYDHDVLNAARELPELKSMPRADFVAWLERNLDQYWYWRKFAVEAIRQNRPRFSAYMIRERVRWYTNVEYGGEQYKVSNNVTPYMSRLLIADIPLLDSIFSRRDISPDEFREAQLDLFQNRDGHHAADWPGRPH